MKDIFPGYYKPSGNEFKNLWAEATFVFDANVLLNLYRYPTEAKNDLLRVLESLTSRIWIPHQAALEYQRNRIAVIADQKKRFQEVKATVSGAISKIETDFSRLRLSERHALINPTNFINEVRPIAEKFQKELIELETKQGNIHEGDPIREKIDSLFKDKVGLPPTEDFIKDISLEGKKRFDINMPPGFRDEKKGEDPDSLYSYGGIQYEGKYGDLIFWNQILQYSKESKIKSLILITDDEKEDWWWKYNSQGEKKLGPRPELVEEIKRKAGVDNFYMYNTESFLKLSASFLSSKINEESIEQVREARNSYINQNDYMHWLRLAELSVAEWIRESQPKAQVKSSNWPDFKVMDEAGRVSGYEVVKAGRNPMMHIRDRLYRAYHDVKEGRFDFIEFILIFTNEEDIDKSIKLLESIIEIPTGVRLSYGRLLGNIEDRNMKFIKVGDVKSLKQQSELFKSENVVV